MFGRSRDNIDAVEGTKKAISLKDVFFTLLILVLFVSILWVGHYGWGRITELNSKNMTLLEESSGLKTKNDLLIKQNELLTKEKGELLKQVEFLTQAKKDEEFRSRGINPDILEIKTLSVESSWQISSIKYEIKKVYLTPDIADLGADRDQPDLINKNFLMVEIDISDVRTSGDEQVVPASDYLNLRKGGLDSKPFTQDYLSLSPQKKGTVYSGFAVDKSDTKFELRSGYLTNADVLTLDFESTGSGKLNGVFLLKKGFAREYRE